jgi:hypothetical protein
VSKALYTFEHNGPVPSLPDVYLDELNWVSATSGWANVPKKKLSIDGYSLNAGGKAYTRGLGTNTNSEVVNTIPEGANDSWRQSEPMMKSRKKTTIPACFSKFMRMRSLLPPHH